MEDLQDDHLSNLDLEIDNQVREKLSESIKWAKFISIMMFIASAVLLLFGLIGGAAITSIFRNAGGAYNVLGDMTGGVFIIIIVFIALVIAVVYYFLYNYSVKIKNALISENIETLNAGLKSLKLFFMIGAILGGLSLINEIVKLFTN
jgi:hypothetical protein